MKILIYGAGVLGSLYAAELQAGGQDVTLLARGERYRQLEEHGILLENVTRGVRTLTRVRLTSALDAEEAYDWIIVLVRKNQLESVLAELESHRRSPNVLLMLNNAAGIEPVVARLGRERVAFGFPGAGGMRLGPVVRYAIARGQPTTLGEVDGRVSERLVALAGALRSAGFATAFSDHIDAWLKTHAALVTPVAGAIYMAGGSINRLANTPDALIILLRAMRENLAALQAAGVPITPAGANLYRWMPEPLLVLAASRLFRTRAAEVMMQRHANAARDEMSLLSDEVYALTAQSGLPTPNVDELRKYFDPQEALVAEGSAELRMDYRGLALALSLTAAALFLLLRRPRR